MGLWFSLPIYRIWQCSPLRAKQTFASTVLTGIDEVSEAASLGNAPLSKTIVSTVLAAINDHSNITISGSTPSVPYRCKNETFRHTLSLMILVRAAKVVFVSAS
jgi:hypothetical protein